jgi:outer membrane receptor for ferrienterochelin and colicins
VLRAALAASVRPPKLGDLNPVVETKGGTPTDPDKIGNPDLKPEKSKALELGIEHYLDERSGLLAFNLFNRDIEDLIEQQTFEQGGRFVRQPVNAGDGRLYGAELEYQQPLERFGVPGLVLSLNYSRLYSKIEDARTGEERRIKDQPPYVCNLGLDWKPRGSRFSAGLNYNVIPELETDAPKDDGTAREIKTESAKKLLDVYAGWRFTPRWGLRLTAYNVLEDEKFRDQTNFKDDGSFASRETRREQPARAVLLSLESRW